jgi:hypothetical protein
MRIRYFHPRVCGLREHGPRVEYDAVNAIPANPYTAPYEDLRRAKR